LALWLGSSAIAVALLFEESAVADPPPESEAAVRAQAPDPSWQVNTSLSGSLYTLPSTEGTAEGVDFAMTRFLAPLHDDGAPYSLEPFLQRSSTVSVALNGGHFSTRNPFGGEDRTHWNGGVSGSFDIYAKRWLALNAGLSYGYGILHDVGISESTHALDGFAELGLRLANTRFDAWYGFDALESAGSFAPLRQRVGASAFTAIARRFTLSLVGSLIPSGGRGSLSAEYFETRELGIYTGAFAGRGKFYSTDVISTRYAGWIGLATWLDPSFGIDVNYELTIDVLDEQVEVRELTHALTFNAFARFDEL
jgi:hypothetical protein